MAILLTGATGFIGSAVLQLCQEKPIITYGRTRPTFNQSKSFQCTHITGDIGDGSGLESICWDEIDYVIHLAAAGVKAVRRDQAEADKVNRQGTVNLLNAIEAAGVNPTIFYAKTFYENCVAAFPTLRGNPYVESKLQAGQVVDRFAESYAGKLIFGTFFQIYGPGDHPKNIINYAATEIKAGRTPVLGSGAGARDWCYISDAAAAVVHSLSLSGRRSKIDIGSGELTRIRTVIETLVAIAGGKVAPVFDPSRSRDDLSIAEKAEHLPAGWSPKVSLQEGLRLTYLTI